MNKKIAICIPSFNESHIIKTTLEKVDKELKKYMIMGYEVIIINIDNASPDKTSEIFMQTNTKCPKISIITNESGKGTNLLKFFEYCKENLVDYAVTIDADVRSMKSNWISKFLNPLLNNSYDYVTPIYRRSRFEGSTTNHFAFPMIYAITGIPIRQPIAGDFAFNKKFIDIIVNQPITESTKRYGIDIYMTLTACFNKLNVYQIELEKKLHNPSYNKMENMFQEVLDSFLFTWKNLKNNSSPTKLENKKLLDNNLNSIISSRKFNHRNRAKEMFEIYTKKIVSKDRIEEQWLNNLKELILEPEKINSIKKDNIFYTFMIRATKFWLESEKISSLNCEKIINEQAENLFNLINK